MTGPEQHAATQGIPEHVWDRRSPSGVWLVGCTDTELAHILLSGEWTTHEVHEAARRLLNREKQS